jgi:hypothetical protein
MRCSGCGAKLADLPTSDRYKFIPTGTYTLYHATHPDNVTSILEHGLRPFNKRKSQFSEDAIWMSADPNGAIAHAKKRNPKADKVALFKIILDTNKYGLHQFLGNKAVFNTHEHILPEDLTLVGMF